MATTPSNQPRRTLLLTGASRGIGHATVKRFSAAGWRVITCSRHPFPENCPWEIGPEDHIQVDLADPAEHRRGDRRDQAAARQRRTARAGQQRRDLAQGGGRQAARLDRDLARRLASRVPGQFLRADHAGARADRRAQGGQGLGRQRHLDRGLARASVRRRRLRHLEGGAGVADARDGVRLRPRSASASTRSRRARSTPRSSRPAPTRSSQNRSRCTASARPTKWRRSSTCCARKLHPT